MLPWQTGVWFKLLLGPIKVVWMVNAMRIAWEKRYAVDGWLLRITPDCSLCTLGYSKEP